MSFLISEVPGEGSSCFKKDPENQAPVEDTTTSVSSAERTKSGGNSRPLRFSCSFLCLDLIILEKMTDLMVPQCQLPEWRGGVTKTEKKKLNSSFRKAKDPLKKKCLSLKQSDF